MMNPTASRMAAKPYGGTEMRFVISGGRVRTSHRAAFKALDELEWTFPAGSEFAEGGAVGYDKIGRAWCRAVRKDHRTFKPDPALDGDGDDAPKRRNERMLRWLQDDPEEKAALICFPGGPGTRHMYDICHRACLPIYDIGVDLDLHTFTIHLVKPRSGPAVLIHQGPY